MKKSLFRTLFVILPFSILMLFGGVFATWSYAGLQANDANTDIPFQMNTFTFWEGAEILPNEEGESHVTLINNLLNGTDANGTEVGLNNPNSAVSQNLENRLNGGLWGLFNKTDHYGSMDGSILDNQVDMEGLFNTDTLGLNFIIQVIDDLTYYIFTTSVDMGASRAPNVPIGEQIYPIYRTVATRVNTSSDFVVQSTAIGHATSKYYEQLSGIGFLHDQYVPSFDVDTWVSCEQSPIGTSKENAIRTFVGDTPSADMPDAQSFAHFKLSGAGERIIQSPNIQAEITVRDSNDNVVAVSQKITVDNNLVVQVAFTAEENQTYYLELTGSNYIQFTVS